MGEVVVSSEEVVEIKTDSETEMGNAELEGNKRRRRKKPTGNSSASSEVVKWERFLPGMSLRVLLVEADDSTRQIIAALLRKCSYRVTVVPDGLKAWEMLKGKPHNIDLILTEADLPSISGYALLTLIMEHEICKSIPVIMMSSQDSISTVYKCMLRGAADYLVKPIRRNELRNLWQHVWRRQSSIVGGNSPQDEAASENNAASNHSSGNLASIQRNKEQTGKGSDAQSSCTKPDWEAECAHMENMQEFSQLTKGKYRPGESQKHEAHASSNHKPLTHGMRAGGADGCKDTCTTTMYNGVELESQRRNAVISVEAGDAVADSPREAIDFMGTFNNNCNYSSINSTSKLDPPPYLDLSLRRCNLDVYENHVTEQRPVVWHPNLSAFTRYTSRLPQSLHSTLTSVGDQKKESGVDSAKLLLNIISEYNLDTPSSTQPSQKSLVSLTAVKQTEAAASSLQQRVLPVPVSVQGIRLNNLCDGYNSVIPPIFCAQSSSSLVPSPNSANQQESAFYANLFRHSSFETNNSRNLYDRLASNTNQSTNQPLSKPEQKLDSIEDRGHISPTTDQSASSSFCNGFLSQLNGIACGNTGASNCNTDLVATLQAPIESTNDTSFPSPGGSSHRSIQREAALTKFRLKRKDRCYEKKVRYESRKKLAEQRPRVKGQFVRQVQADPTEAEVQHHYGNSSNG